MKFPTCETCIHLKRIQQDTPTQTDHLLGIPHSYYTCNFPDYYSETDKASMYGFVGFKNIGQMYVAQIHISNPKKFFCSDHTDINRQRFVNWGKE